MINPRWAAAAILLPAAFLQSSLDAQVQSLSAVWKENFLTIRGEQIPGEVRIHWLEAYCRPGSTDRDWRETVIRHRAELLAVSADGRVIRVRDRLEDGVIVNHTITVGKDEIDFQIVARNPKDTPSLAHWAQPCIRVDKFTSRPTDDARTLVPQYARQCFLYVNGTLQRMPTEPWADNARYIPGQVYCPRHVNRNDVNPRPLSKLVPSNGLTGCFSRDGKQVLAVAFEPYQEIFLGVATCIHSDFRIGGLQPGQTKRIRGKLYLTDANMPQLLRRYCQDFPEHFAETQK